MLEYKPEIREHNDVFTITLMNIDIGLTKASSQVYKMCHFHPLATERTNTTMRVFCPLYNASAVNKNTMQLMHTF